MRTQIDITLTLNPHNFASGRAVERVTFTIAIPHSGAARGDTLLTWVLDATTDDLHGRTFYLCGIPTWNSSQIPRSLLIILSASPIRPPGARLLEWTTCNEAQM